MDLLLTAGLPWPTILYTIFLDEVMIVTGLIGALVKSRYKWGKTYLPSLLHKHILILAQASGHSEPSPCSASSGTLPWKAANTPNTSAQTSPEPTPSAVV